jgi:hypothetical protein
MFQYSQVSRSFVLVLLSEDSHVRGDGSHEKSMFHSISTDSSFLHKPSVGIGHKANKESVQ